MRKKEAFTLVEALIVILIIGLLFVLLTPKIDSITDKARETQIEMKFKEFGDAAEIALMEHSGFTGMTKGGDRAKKDIDKILDALNEYLDSSEIFDVRTDHNLRYRDSRAKDMWGNNYRVKISADTSNNTGTMTFISYGKDGMKRKHLNPEEYEHLYDTYDYAYLVEYKDGIITRTIMGPEDILAYGNPHSLGGIGGVDLHIGW